MANSAFTVVGGSGGPSAATRTDEETGTSTTVFTSPGTQQYHSSAVKGWAQISSSNTLVVGYNVSSVSNNGTGDVTANWTNAFASANAYVALVRSSGGRFYTVISNSSSTSGCRINVFDSNGTGSNSAGYTCLGLGALV